MDVLGRDDELRCVPRPRRPAAGGMAALRRHRRVATELRDKGVLIERSVGPAPHCGFVRRGVAARGFDGGSCRLLRRAGWSLRARRRPHRHGAKCGHRVERQWRGGQSRRASSAASRRRKHAWTRRCAWRSRRAERHRPALAPLRRRPSTRRPDVPDAAVAAAARDVLVPVLGSFAFFRPADCIDAGSRQRGGGLRGRARGDQAGPAKAGGVALGRRLPRRSWPCVPRTASTRRPMDPNFQEGTAPGRVPLHAGHPVRVRPASGEDLIPFGCRTVRRSARVRRSR